MVKGVWEGRIVWQTMHVQMSLLKLQVPCKSFVYMILVFFHRFGVCEVYTGYAVACNDVINIGIDSVYITKSLGTQNDISKILNVNLQNSLFVNHDKDCVNQVFRIICHYFLPPCGTVTNSLPPSSVCQEECSQVRWPTDAMPISNFHSLFHANFQFLFSFSFSVFQFPFPRTRRRKRTSMPIFLSNFPRRRPRMRTFTQRRSACARYRDCHL